jgi:hypothetical protein
VGSIGLDPAAYGTRKLPRLVVISTTVVQRTAPGGRVVFGD